MAKKPTFIVISGGSGSGKTTFANMLLKGIEKKHKAAVISMDWFYLPNPRLEKRNYDAPEAYNWVLLRESLISLMHGKEVTIPFYRFDTQNYRGTKTIKPADCFVFEGILAMYDDTINNLSDLKVFIDVSDDERLIRRILRDVKERNAPVEKTIGMWRDTVIHAHHKYVEPTKFLADISIPFNTQKQKSIDGIIDIVSTMVEQNKKRTNGTKSGKNSK